MKYFISFLLIVCAAAPVSGAEETWRFQKMQPVLKQPWYFKGAAGIAVDEDGYVYVVNKENHVIVKFTSGGEFVTRWGRKGNGEGEFVEPADIAADSVGYVYVTDLGNNRVQKFTWDGTFVRQWEGEDGGFSKPIGIAVSFSGKVYVADNENSRIQIFDTEGQFVGQWKEAGAEGPFGQPEDVAVDRDGAVYVADTDNHRIVKLDKNGVWHSWGIEGFSDGDLKYPHGITADHDGNVYVTDKKSENPRIQKFTSDGTFVTAWGEPGFQNGMLNSPYGLAFDRTGFLYAIDTENQCVQKFTPEGRFVSKWGISFDAGFFNSPESVAVSDDGSVFVCDTKYHRIQKLSFSRDWEAAVTDWGRYGSGDREFNEPHGIALDSDGNIYVADTYNHRIQKFSPDGGFIKAWGEFGKEDEQFRFPYGIAADRKGHIYVADRANKRIQKFDADGGFISKWVTQPELEIKFEEPADIAIDSKGYVYVADPADNCIQKFDGDGSLLHKWGACGDGDAAMTGEDAFDGPSGIAVETVEGDDFIYVADTYNHRIQKYSSEGELITQWGTTGSLAGQMSYPRDVAVDGYGNVIVADTDNHRIQIFKKTETESVQKGIVIAGGGPFPGNRLWDATRLSANFAYRTLNYQGISKENIFYLSSDYGLLDLDGNGEADDVFDVPSKENLASAVSQAGDAQRLIFYLADHGGVGKFRLSETETLSAEELDELLDQFQSSLSKEVIVIYDACNAGSFAGTLTSDGNRIFMGGSGADQNAYFISQGTISFSSFFWTNIFNGEEIDTAFEGADRAVRMIPGVQEPVRRGAFSSGEVYIGNGAPVSVRPPEISDSTIHSDTLEVTVTNSDEVARIWGLLLPPSYAPEASDTTILEFPSVELLPEGDGIYRGSLAGIADADRCTPVIYVRDRFGNTFHGDAFSGTPGTGKSRKAILISGDVRFQPVLSPAENALRFQGYSDEEIHMLNPPENKAAIRQTMESLLSETDDVLIFLTGEGRPKSCGINGSEKLTAEELDGWLDELQNRTHCNAVFIYDADYSGSFIPEMEGEKRILITGSSADRPAYFLGGGISFSGFFWKNIQNGMNLNRAFREAGNAVAVFYGDSDIHGPKLDDNGNGIANESADGRTAAEYTVGYGIKLAEHLPQVTASADAEKPEIISDGTTAYTITVENISSVSGIQAVWAVITPPGGSSEDEEPQKLELTSTGSSGYEGTYEDFHTFGIYQIAVYAQDAEGGISIAENFSVLQPAGEDIYEDDDRRERAGVMVINDEKPQHHSFHNTDDSDWIVFYGIADTPYEIYTWNPGSVCNHIVWLNGTEIQASVEMPDPDGGGIRSVFSWTCSQDGIRYLRIAPDVSRLTNYPAQYTIEIIHPVAPFSGYVTGTVTDSRSSDRPIRHAWIKTVENTESTLTRSSGHFLMSHPPGEFSFIAGADGYTSAAPKRKTVGETGTTVVDFSLTPVSPSEPLSVSIASPSSDIVIEPGDAVSFSGGADGGSPPLRFHWTFGDGEIPDSSVQNPDDVIFRNEGTFTVTLTVSDSNGNAANASVRVTVNPDTEPNVRIAEPASDITVKEGDTVSFEGRAEGGNPELHYHWRFEGGVPDAAEAPSCDVVFPKAGVHRITFSVTDNDGDTSEDGLTITVTEAPTPATSAAITSPDSSVSVKPGDSIVFEGTVTGGTQSFSYLWTFGDSGIPDSRVQNPGAVTFPKAGNFTVSFSATGGGETFRDSVIIEVTEASPETPLSAVVISPVSPHSVKAGESVLFEGSVTGGTPPFTYVWTYGDSGIPNSGEQNPGSVEFPDAGNFTVTFSVTDSGGNSAGNTVSVEVAPEPVVEDPVTVTVTLGDMPEFSEDEAGGAGCFVYTCFKK